MKNKLIFIPEERSIFGVTTKAEFPQQMRELKEFLKSEQ